MADFLNAIADEEQPADSLQVDEIMRRITGEEPKMWGPAIVGYGLRHLKYDSGREMDGMVIRDEGVLEDLIFRLVQLEPGTVGTGILVKIQRNPPLPLWTLTFRINPVIITPLRQ